MRRFLLLLLGLCLLAGCGKKGPPRPVTSNEIEPGPQIEQPSHSEVRV